MFPVTINMNASFLGATRRGSIFGEARVLQLGRAIAFLQSNSLHPLFLPRDQQAEQGVPGSTLCDVFSDRREAAVNIQLHPIHEARIV